MKHLALLVIALSLIVLASPVARADLYEHHDGGTKIIDGEANYREFIIVFPVAGNDTYRVMYPQTFMVHYYVERAIHVKTNSRIGNDPADMVFDTKGMGWDYDVYKPGEILYWNDSKILATYFASMNAYGYANRYYLLFTYEWVRVTFTLNIFFRFTKPPDYAGVATLEDFLKPPAYKGTAFKHIMIEYWAAVDRHKKSGDDWVHYNVTGKFWFKTYSLKFYFYRIKLKHIVPEVTGYTAIGNYTRDGWIGIMPKGDVHVTVCMDGAKDKKLTLLFKYRTPYSTSEKKVVIKTNSCPTVTFYDVPLMPGNYTGNNKLSVEMSTGAFQTNLLDNALIPGEVAIAGKPIVIITKNGDSLVARVYIGVSIESFKDRFPVTVKASGTIQSSAGAQHFTCQAQQVKATSVYTCQVPLRGGTLKDYANSTATVHVELSGAGTTVSGTSKARATVIGGVGIGGIMGEIYNWSLNISTIIFLAVLLLYVFNMLLASITGNPLLDPDMLRGALWNSISVLVILFFIPLIQVAFLQGLYGYEGFRKYMLMMGLTPSSIHQLYSSPGEAMAYVSSFYTNTISTMMTDFKVMVVGTLKTAIITQIVFIGALITGIIALGIALSAIENGMIAGALASPVVSLISIIAGAVLTIVPLISIVLGVLSLTNAIMVLITAMFLIMLPVAIILALSPWGGIGELGAEALGAEIFFLTTAPVFGPVVYIFYMYVRNQILESMQASILGSNTMINIALGPIGSALTLNLGNILLSLVKAYAFLALVGITSSLIIVLFASFLRYAPLFVGLGEAVVRASRR